MFKQDDYIVCLEILTKSDCSKKDYIFKQRKDNNGMHPYIDLEGSKINGNTSHTFNKLQSLKDWRYATFEEIEEYDRIGKPYDVTTLNQFILPTKWCVIDTDDEQSDDLYKYATEHGAMPPYSKNVHHKKESNFYHFPPINGCTTCSNLEEDYTLITINQFKQYVLNQKVIKEDMSYLIQILEKLK